MAYIVYKITNRVNWKIYIGQTTGTLGRRWTAHKKDALAGKGYLLHAAMRLYGIENFTIEIVGTAWTPDELSALETKWILNTKSNNPNFGYNIMDSASGNPLTPISRKRRSSSTQRAVRNKPLKTCSKYVGIRPHIKGTWLMSLVYLGEHYSKVYETEELAASSYDKFALKMHGPNAVLNFPNTIYSKEEIDAVDQDFGRTFTSYFAGVTKRETRWWMQVNIDNDAIIFHATFLSEFEAAIAYDLKMMQLGMDIGHLNFPNMLPEYIKINADEWIESRRTRRPPKVSKYHGVSFSYYKENIYYISRIRINNKVVCLGSFKTQKAAAKAYNEAIIKYGAFYRTPNTIEE